MEPATKDDVGSKSELKIWRERHAPDASPDRVEVSSLDPFDGLHALDGPFALVATQVFDGRHALEKTKLTVNSPHILKAFRDVIESHPTLPVDFQDPFEMVSPFKALYHHWDDLVHYGQNLEDVTARKHVDILCAFMEAEMGREKRRIDAMIVKGQIDFDSLWAIFKPRELMVMYSHDHLWQSQLTKTAYEQTDCDGRFLEVHQTFTSSDGSDPIHSTQVTKIFQRSSFPQDSPGSIDELPVRPSKLVKGSVSQSELVERGKQYLKMKAKTIYYCDGFSEYLKPPPDDFFDPRMSNFEHVWLPYTETGRVIVDPKTFQEDHKTQRGVKILDVTDRDLSLCPPFVHGYSLGRKQWCRLYLPYLHEVEWKPNSYDSLIIPEKQIHLVRALVSTHKFPENARDFMDQKGKGLVALLHGPPGSGKTLTAECAAEASHRALLSTSISELNEDNYAPLFERNLQRLLRLATVWKAVVLFDEADVFLETRGAIGEKDVDRNSTVAVFLRQLEYFSGIVFLTTNRVKVFDAAMKSRIHLALGYEVPDKASLRRIWTNALKKIPENDRDLDLDVVSDLLAQEPINGREVSNTINTAYTLARYEGSPLKQTHLETVFEVRRQFETTLHGK